MNKTYFIIATLFLVISILINFNCFYKTSFAATSSIPSSKYHFSPKDGEVREFGDVHILNLITKNNSENLSLAVATVTGEHPPTLSIRSDRAYYVISGTADITVGTQRYSVVAGDAIFIPMNTLHKIVGNVKYVVINSPSFDVEKEK